MGINDFSSFIIEPDDYSVVEDGKLGARIVLSLFNPLFPVYYKNKALDMLMDFIESSENISIESIDSISCSAAAYIGRNIDLKCKYEVSIYIWNKEVGSVEDYLISYPILSTDEYFREFIECVMEELRNMVFDELECN